MDIKENPFENNQVAIGDLPSIEDLAFQSLERRSIKADLLITAIIFTILCLVAVSIGIMSGDRLYIILVAILPSLILIFILISFFVYKSYKFKGYAIRVKDITYKSGIFFRNITTIPFNRIQHVEVEQGPIDRWFNLGSVTIFTAGGSSSDLEVHGLSFENANAIKRFIINKAGLDEEE